MRKLFLGAFVAALLVTAASAQTPGQSSSDTKDIPNMGHAPQGPDGLGRLDARVFDADGNPVNGASLKLESNRLDGFFCESWNATDARGVAVLPPLHMGRLRLIVKAKGYETQKLTVDPSTLNEPLRITLKKSE
jgi:hypothetical protein